MVNIIQIVHIPSIHDNRGQIFFVNGWSKNICSHMVEARIFIMAKPRARIFFSKKNPQDPPPPPGSLMVAP